MKVVINACYGGFGLSHEAILRYAEIKGITLYVEPTNSALVPYNYYTVPKELRVKETPYKEFITMPLPERAAYNKRCSEESLYARAIPRDDPALVQVVEEMGRAADGDCARLEVVEIPDDVAWHIEEYDGNEHVAEDHRTWR